MDIAISRAKFRLSFDSFNRVPAIKQFCRGNDASTQFDEAASSLVTFLKETRSLSVGHKGIGSKLAASCPLTRVKVLLRLRAAPISRRACVSSEFLARKGRIGGEERFKLERRGERRESSLRFETLCCLTARKKKRKRRVRWVSGENLWRIFMEMQILFSPMNALRKRKMHAKDGNLPFSDRDPFNSANKTSLLCNYVVSPEGSVTVSINLSLTFQPYLSSFRNGNCAIKVNEGINPIYMC